MGSITKHQSEWVKDMHSWRYIEKHIPDETRFDWEYTKTKIANYAWWDEVKTKVKGFPQGDAFYFHPAGFVGNFLSYKRCYCEEMSYSNSSCNGNGAIVSKETFMADSERLGVEPEVIAAIMKQESGHGSFIPNYVPKHAKILFEKHHMRRYLIAKIGKTKTEALRIKHPDLISVAGARNGKPYGSVRSQVDKLRRAKLLDKDAAIMSCSWGMGQVMGKTYKWLYKTPSDLEKAQNQCLKQQYLYMLKYFENVHGMVKAMKDKNWIKMAILYNGSGWVTTNPNYPTNVKKYYESFKKNGL